ncbi:MAG: universal stress protein [Chloroflexia bacterium]
MDQREQAATGVSTLRVLASLDGSLLAEKALPFAEALAREGDGTLILTRAVLAHSLPGVDAADAQRTAVSEAEDYLEKVAATLSERGITTETAVPHDEAGRGIVEEARLRRADLIVMSTHGRGGLGRWVYGSVAEAVLAASTVPVMLVRAWVVEVEPSRLTQKPCILTPLDGSAFAEGALPTAHRFCDAFGEELVILRVALRPDLVFGPDRLLQSELAQELATNTADATEYLRVLAARLAEEGESAPTYELHPDGVTSDIAQAAREHGAAMVVMTTHAHTGVNRILIGSVAGGVVRDGDLPLVLVPPGAAHPASSS